MTATEPTIGEPFLPGDPAFLRDPHQRFAQLRERGPCLFDRESGFWFLLSYGAVEAGLTQIIRGVSATDSERQRNFPANPFKADGPPHTGPRRVIAPALTNRAVQRYRGRAQQIVDDALAGKEAGGELRVVDELGFDLPYQITCDLLGIPDVDNRDELREWTWKVQDLSNPFPTEEQFRDNLEAARLLSAHIHEVEVWKRQHLGDDLFSMVIAAADAGEVMKPDQVASYIHTLYLAGMHTTLNQTALSLWALLGHRDQWDLLLREPDLLENAVEELLRFEGVAQFMRRVPDHDVEIAGVTIPAGEEMLCWLASANRDEERYGPSAGELDITRPDARTHLAFGKGAHVCLGAWLARMELQVVLGTILERFPAAVMAEQELEWHAGMIRGPEELVIELRPA